MQPVSDLKGHSRLDQYGSARFVRLIFATIRKKCGTERVK